MMRIAPRLTAIFLCSSALALCATASYAGADKDQASDIGKTAPTDLESSLHQAQLLRTARRYDEAIRILSQLVLVASDNSRVVGEYGKTLAERGRAQDAVQFLSRSVELAANDWTVFSALGVAYDQVGDQASAKTAYEHALALRPGEPSVLNNYALSRMLANDPNGAHALMARTEAAGGAADPKIARNIAMLNRLAPIQAVQAASAQGSGAPGAGVPPQTMASTPPKPAPILPVTTAALAPVTPQAPRPLAASPTPTIVPSNSAPFQAAAPKPMPPAVSAPAALVSATPPQLAQHPLPAGTAPNTATPIVPTSTSPVSTGPVSTGMPRALTPNASAANASAVNASAPNAPAPTALAPTTSAKPPSVPSPSIVGAAPHPVQTAAAPTASTATVVMERVPFDPLAGPVKGNAHTGESHGATPHEATPTKTEAAKVAQADTAATAKPAAAKPEAKGITAKAAVASGSSKNAVPALRLAADIGSP